MVASFIHLRQEEVCQATTSQRFTNQLSLIVIRLKNMKYHNVRSAVPYFYSQILCLIYFQTKLIETRTRKIAGIYRFVSILSILVPIHWRKQSWLYIFTQNFLLLKWRYGEKEQLKKPKQNKNKNKNHPKLKTAPQNQIRTKNI